MHTHTQGFNLGVGPLIGLVFQALLRAARVDARLATGLLIVSCLVRIVHIPGSVLSSSSAAWCMLLLDMYYTHSIIIATTCQHTSHTIHGLKTTNLKHQPTSKKQPTTVNMCIVLSSAARASLATAVFNAVLSNFLGVFVAPATIFLCAGAAAVNVPYLAVVRKLVYKVQYRRRKGRSDVMWAYIPPSSFNNDGGGTSHDGHKPQTHTINQTQRDRCSFPCCWA